MYLWKGDLVFVNFKISVIAGLLFEFILDSFAYFLYLIFPLLPLLTKVILIHRKNISSFSLLSPITSVRLQFLSHFY